jgi:hypothetical protein
MYGELPEVNDASGTPRRGYPIVIQNPQKTALVRLPTSPEILTYLSAQRSLYRDLGRRMGEGEDVPTPKADLALFSAIRVDKDGPEFDEAEAAYALELILRCSVTKCETVGSNYEVGLGTIFGPTRHIVSIPYRKDMAEYRRDMYKPRDLPHGLEERRFPPEVPVKLYDKIAQSSTGYAADTEVPPHHKRAVVIEVVNALALLDPAIDPN